MEEEKSGFMDKLSELVTDFDMEKFMPELDTVLGWVELLARIAVLVGPLLITVLGFVYFFMPPKEANHRLGYRFYWGMGSVEAWRFTQKIAGLGWMVMGLVLSVIMFLVCNGFRGMETMEMVDTAVTCLLWEVGLIALVCIVIDAIVLLRYNSKGEVRPNTVIRVPKNFLELGSKKRTAK